MSFETIGQITVGTAGLLVAGLAALWVWAGKDAIAWLREKLFGGGAKSLALLAAAILIYAAKRAAKAEEHDSRLLRGMCEDAWAEAKDLLDKAPARVRDDVFRAEETQE